MADYSDENKDMSLSSERPAVLDLEPSGKEIEDNLLGDQIQDVFETVMLNTLGVGSIFKGGAAGLRALWRKAQKDPRFAKTFDKYIKKNPDLEKQIAAWNKPGGSTPVYDLGKTDEWIQAYDKQLIKDIVIKNKLAVENIKKGVAVPPVDKLPGVKTPSRPALPGVKGPVDPIAPFPNKVGPGGRSVPQIEGRVNIPWENYDSQGRLNIPWEKYGSAYIDDIMKKWSRIVGNETTGVMRTIPTGGGGTPWLPSDFSVRNVVAGSAPAGAAYVAFNKWLKDKDEARGDGSTTIHGELGPPGRSWATATSHTGEPISVRPYTPRTQRMDYEKLLIDKWIEEQGLPGFPLPDDYEE